MKRQPGVDAIRCGVVLSWMVCRVSFEEARKELEAMGTELGIKKALLFDRPITVR